MDGYLRVERTGDLVVATFVGQPTEALLIDCHEQVLRLVDPGVTGRVLYDAREMQAPTFDVPWAQRQIDARPSAVKLRRAIVVSNTKIGFLARLAFGDGDYRVFYDDVAAATKWLQSVD